MQLWSGLGFSFFLTSTLHYRHPFSAVKCSHSQQMRDEHLFKRRISWQTLTLCFSWAEAWVSRLLGIWLGRWGHSGRVILHQLQTQLLLTISYELQPCYNTNNQQQQCLGSYLQITRITTINNFFTSLTHLSGKTSISNCRGFQNPY